MDVKIWHNPRCSKSRQTLALLEDAGYAPEVIRYLDTPPTETELRALLRLLNLPALTFMRTGEKTFGELGLSRESSEAELIAAMAANPILIERPVVFANDRAAVGRPPEAVLSLFR